MELVVDVDENESTRTRRGVGLLGGGAPAGTGAGPSTGTDSESPGTAMSGVGRMGSRGLSRVYRRTAQIGGTPPKLDARMPWCPEAPTDAPISRSDVSWWATSLGGSVGCV